MTLYSAILLFCNAAMLQFKVYFGLMMLVGFLLVGNQPVRAQSLPYSYDFESNDTSFHRHPVTDTSGWRLANGGVSSSRCLVSEYVTNALGFKAEEYFASKRLNLTAGNTYQVSFQSKVDFSNRRKVKLALHTTDSREGSTLIHDFDTLTNTESYETYTTTFSVDSSGYYFLIYYGEALAGHLSCPWFTDDFSVTLVNTPPTVMLVEPSNNSWFDPDQSVGLAATVSDAESNVTKVEFYEGSNKVAEDYTPNGLGIYTAGYLPANGGSHSLTAKAIDSYGASNTSSSRTINVRYLPQASITNLTAHTYYFEGIQPVTASASDADGTIQCVVFYLNNDSIGTDSTAPYEMNIPLVIDENQSQQTIQVKAVDNDGLTGLDEKLIKILPSTCSLTTPNNSLSQIMCMGDSIGLSSEEESETTGFQWIYKANPASNWEELASSKPGIFAHQPGYYAIMWTYENNAVCTTAVDTVSTLQISVPTVYIYGDQPAMATVSAFGGVEPYTYTWSSYDTCLSAACDSVMISDFSNPVVVTVTDDMSCGVSDTVGVNHLSSRLCGTQEPDSTLSASPYNEEQVGAMFNAKETEFQNYISENKDKNEVPGWDYEEVLVPIVFYVFYPPLKAPYSAINRKINDSVIVKQLDEINNRFQGQEFKVNGKATRFRFCLAKQFLDSNQVSKPIIDATFLPPADQARIKAKSSTSGIVYIIDSTLNYKFYNNPFSFGAAARTQILSRFSRLDSKRNIRVFISNVYGSGYLGGSYLAISSFLKEQLYVEDENNPNLRAQYFSDLDPSFIRRINHNHFQRFDGLFMTKDVIGSPSYTPYPANFYRLGKKPIHELGHFFGLWHTSTPNEYKYPQTIPFECKDSLIYISEYPMADFVQDTPPQKKSTNLVSTFSGANINSCSTARLNQLADSTSCGGFPRPLTNNPMDYVSDACQDTFTTGQVERMVYGASFYRPDLISPENAAMAGIQCRPSPGFYLRKDFYCSQADSTEFTIYLAKGGTLTSDSIRLNLSSNQYKIATQNADSVKIRLYPPSGIPASFIVTRKIHFSGEPSGGMAYSKPIYFSAGPCGLADAAKSRLIFGQYACLASGSNGLYEPNTAVHNSKPDSNRIYAYGGSVTYNHPQTGNLLFYAAGKHLWNKNHKRLTTYNSVLMGSDSSAQYGIALPHPTDTNLVSLFTVPSQEESSLGFRMHNIRLANINYATSPTLNGSYLNKPILIPTKHPIQRGNNSAIKVADKITVVPKACAATGYWIIVQGYYTDANYRNKFLIFSFDATDTIPRFVDSCFAGGWAKNGVIKAAPDGFSLVATHTNANLKNGAGNGYAPKLFRFAPEYGKMTYQARLTAASIPDSVSAFGASFTGDSRFIYLSVNNLGTDTGFAQRRGIFRFDTEALSGNNLTGTRIGNVKDNHANVALALDGYGSILINQYHRDALDVIHQPSAGVPEIHRNAIRLTNDPEKAIRSWQGLPNFVDAKRYNVVPDSGLTQSDPWRLGTNPHACCPTPYVLNVACTGNEDSTLTTGNDVFYEVTLTKINGNFKNLVVSSTLSEFPTTIKVGVFTGSTPLQIGATPITSGNGQWIIITGDEIVNALGVINIGKFQIVVNANSPGAVGNFKTKIYTEFPNPEDNEANCCRMAVDGKDQISLAPNSERQGLKQKDKNNEWMIYPNPAGNQIFIESLEKGSVQILDILGKQVADQIKIQEKISIPLNHLPTGIYQVRLSTGSSVWSKTLSIQK